MSSALKTLQWKRGELLNVRRYSDGTFRITRLGDEYDPSKANGLESNREEAQEFVSHWYAPSSVRERS